jgi:hypothetical protein
MRTWRDIRYVATGVPAQFPLLKQDIALTILTLSEATCNSFLPSVPRRR